MSRILIIDDDGDLRSFMRTVLEEEGHEIVEASDGRSGLERYASNPTDLVVTDIFMPGKEGLETIMELRRANPAARIVAVSGGGRFGQTNVLETAEKFGASATIEKPFSRRKLLNVVGEALRQN